MNTIHMSFYRTDVPIPAISAGQPLAGGAGGLFFYAPDV